MRKLMTWIFVLALSASYITSAGAVEIEQNHNLIDNIEIEQLSEEYDLQELTAEQIPEGIVPIEFETVDDAERFLESLFDSCTIGDAYNEDEVVQSSVIQGVLASGASSGIQTKDIPDTNIYLWKGVGTLSYTWEEPGSYKKFVDITDFEAYYSGLELFVDYELKGYSYDFNAINTEVTITFTGKTTYYIFINGIGKIASRVDTSDVSFSASDT